jgi:threonine 3-dehydrogenase
MINRSVTVPRFRGNGLIEFEPYEYPAPGKGELLVAVGANAICGTDRQEFFNGSLIVPGHEAAGVVVETGPDTNTVPGTRGAVYLMDFCGSCRSCVLGATNQCLDKRADVGQTSNGGYGPYLVTHESNFFSIDNATSLTEATMLLDVMGTSGHAISRAQRMRDDIESLYIAGAGPIGLGLLAMAKIVFGDDLPIGVSDVNPWRMQLADSLGALVFDARDEAAIIQFAPDVAFDASGRQSARQLALSALTKRGSLICVGHGETVTIDVSRDLIAPERAVIGSEYFRYDEMAQNLRRLQQHRDLMGRVITHSLPVSEIQRAFELFFAGQTGKVVITQDLAQ